jgi:formiminoglutamase
MFTPYPISKIPRGARIDDPSDIRLGGYVQIPDSPQLTSYIDQISEGDVVILGYSDDRGVERNGGRTGSAEAPDEIRKLLYNFCPGFDPTVRALKIWDLGNFKSWSLSLEEAHEEARKVIATLHRQNARILSLGGGHDWAFPDFVDFANSTKKDQTPFVINFDAHLDVRPNPESPETRCHSGTPFRRIVEATSKSGGLALAAFGLQKHCNSVHHIQWAQGQRITQQFLEDLPHTFPEQWTLLEKRLDLKKSHRIGLSLDMDVFSASYAPGVSAPQALGLDPLLIQAFIQAYAKQTPHFGIYEYNPRFDVDARSARLAAKLIHTWILHG